MAFVTEEEINHSNPSQKAFPGQTVEVRIDLTLSQGHLKPKGLSLSKMY